MLTCQPHGYGCEREAVADSRDLLRVLPRTRRREMLTVGTCRKHGRAEPVMREVVARAREDGCSTGCAEMRDGPGVFISRVADTRLAPTDVSADMWYERKNAASSPREVMRKTGRCLIAGMSAPRRRYRKMRCDRPVRGSRGLGCARN